MGVLTFFTNKISQKIIDTFPQKTYWSFWTTKAYSSYCEADMAYDTMVNYSDSVYSIPTEVYYYQTGIYAPY